jgi:hypothetical protein
VVKGREDEEMVRERWIVGLGLKTTVSNEEGRWAVGGCIHGSVFSRARHMLYYV